MLRHETRLTPALAFLRERLALDHALGSTSKRMQARMGVTAQQPMLLWLDESLDAFDELFGGTDLTPECPL